VAKSFIARRATRQTPELGERVRYDADRDIALVLRDGNWVAAIVAGSGPQTKKADIEKGEDQKDRWR
jgi:hypothetical protein